VQVGQRSRIVPDPHFVRRAKVSRTSSSLA
jgi:hypothetical protein